MPVQEFLTNGTWAWPENIVHCTAIVLSQGGGGHALQGGGGTGGNLVAKEIYKASFGSSPLTITVNNSGGAAGTNGADSKIVQNSAIEILSKGGKGATDSTGAVNSSAGCIGTLTILGGNGGTGAFGRGGGGGAASPFSLNSTSDPTDWIGHNAPTPGDPTGDMRGGISSGTFGGGTGDGGNGADSGENGHDGHNYGGGGGGGGVIAGKGGDARVAILWGLGLGATKFSVGKCCSICDIAKKFPSTVTAIVNLTDDSADNPDFDPGTYTVGPVTFEGGFEGCDATPFDDIVAGPVTADQFVPDSDMPAQLNGMSGNALERVSFSSDRGLVSTPTGVQPAWYCQATYACPLSPSSLDDGARNSGFLAISDRWCLSGTHPGGTGHSLVSQGCSDTCGTATVQEWGIYGALYCSATATVQVWVTAGQKWYAQFGLDLNYYCKYNQGFETTGGGYPGFSNDGPPNLATFYALGVAGMSASSAVLGPYDTPDEALTAIKTPVNVGPISGGIGAGWQDFGAVGGLPILSGGLGDAGAWVFFNSGCEECAPIGPFLNCASTSPFVTVGIDPQQHIWYTNPSYLGIVF